MSLKLAFLKQYEITFLFKISCHHNLFFNYVSLRMKDIFWLGISHIKDWQTMHSDGSWIATFILYGAFILLFAMGLQSIKM